MGQITADQSQEIMATFATGVKWSEIDFDALGLQDSAIRNKKEACRNFEAFLRNGCRLVAPVLPREAGELVIEIPALPRPTLAEIQAKYPRVRSIDRDTSPETSVTLKLATVLSPNEKEVGGKEYERRLGPTPDALLGYQHWQWLLEHQDEHLAFMAFLGKVYIDFPGIVVVSGDGGRSVPCCDCGGARWDDGWTWLDDGFKSGGRMAVASK